MARNQRRGPASKHETMRRLPTHWPEYAIDGICLGVFMVSAAAWATLLQHPASPVSAHVVGWPALQRALMGVAMGATAAALIYSPLGQRSGAHMNPAVTLTFAALGRVAWPDAVGYVAGQFLGGLAGLLVAVWALASLPADPSVNFVATVPGAAGRYAAFAAEALISFLMMSTVLRMSGDPIRARFTGLAAGALVATFITVESPVSGMSMNLARTLPSNVLAGQTSSLWIYATAPALGMLTAAAQFTRRHGLRAPGCAKLHHTSAVRCIFCGRTSEPSNLRTSEPSNQ